MLKIIKHRKIWLIVTALIIGGSATLIAILGLNLGIDFTGGTLLEVTFLSGKPANQEIEEVFADEGIFETVVQAAEGENAVVRMPTIEESQKRVIINRLAEQFGPVEEVRFELIGPTIGKELKERALEAVGLVLIAIVLYIAYAFRKVSGEVKSWRFGVCAIFALVHDILVVVGVFAVLGWWLGIEVGSLFVTALLTVLGFSVHDTIVVFDRTRFNLIRQEGNDLPETVELSVNQTLIRSINTSLTTLIVLLCLYLFGGETIQWFVFALMIGVVAGTYSSIFVASPILVAWDGWAKKRKSRR